MTKQEHDVIEKEFEEEFTQQEGFGGIGGAGVRTVFEWPDNPDYRDEILIDQLKAYLFEQIGKAERRKCWRCKLWHDHGHLINGKSDPSSEAKESH